MAKVYLTCGSVYHDMIGPSTRGSRVHTYSIVRQPIMPEHWSNEKGEVLGKIQLKTQLRLYDENQTLTTETYLNSSGGKKSTISGETTKVTVNDSANLHFTYPVGRKMTQFPHDDPPVYLVVDFASYPLADGGSDEIRLYGHFIETVFDVAYDGGPAARCSRNANKLYAPDYPVSAWHLANLLCDTLNKILYEAKLSQTHILFAQEGWAGAVP